MNSENYVRGETVDVKEEFGVIDKGDDKYVGKKPLVKPIHIAPGVYGGNLAGQALLVAMKSTEPEFKPHSLHSFFVRAATDESPIEWEVERISSGKTFCNRAVKGFQNGKIVFFANISLTKKNSYKESLTKWEEETAKFEQRGKDGDVDEDDEDDDKVPQKPFRFQTPLHDWVKKYGEDSLVVSPCESNMLSYFKFCPDFIHLDKSEYEKDVPIAQRKFSFLVRWGIDNEQGYNQPLTNVDEQFQFVGLANLSDALILNVLARVLRLGDVSVQDNMKNFFGVSLDHILYIHDNDFDVTKWMTYSFKTIRFSHDRVLFEGELYNHNGVHVASVIQEGLVKLAGAERDAKL
ncbi:hypothetical protein CANMA_002034 [Candida margitis]|uniref:uncharacterized protein n=1 Tax=Candida margitis TaxID=1775924 RepID=UPI00222805EA|nr:uncharacterized protein CANMA_002034 [Candida margitis]KAI5968860.1 hypothetical protein CANMA_002034 [Candida margitis]